jgi:hypothetical protein
MPEDLTVINELLRRIRAQSDPHPFRRRLCWFLFGATLALIPLALYLLCEWLFPWSLP